MFIPIESVNIFVYLAYKQLIMPFKYRPNSNPSIQENFPNQILISKNRWIENCNVSVEIDIDKKLLDDIGNDFFLLNTILPISRIKKIWFRDKEQMTVTIGNIRISSAFVPQNLLKVDNNIIEYKFNIKNLKIPELFVFDFTNEINLFDKYLGGLIVLKDFKKDYNSILSFFDDKINHNFESKVLEFLTADSNLKTILMERQLNFDDVKKRAEKDKQVFKKFAGMVEIHLIDKDSLAYIYAILHRHRRKMKDNFDGLLIEIDYLKNTKIEKYKGFLFLYGIMLGYSKLSLELYFQNKLVCNRFKFEDKKDFQVLESVYNKVFKKYIPTKKTKILRKDRVKEISKIDLKTISVSNLSKKYSVSERTIKKDIKEIILKSKNSFTDKVKILKIYNMKMSKSLQQQELEDTSQYLKLSLSELSDKFCLSIATLIKKIKAVLLTSSISKFTKNKILEKLILISSF